MDKSKAKVDYQPTLNLPKTDFSMKAGLVQKEPEYLARWEKEDLYGKIRKSSSGKTSYILHDGPPYANGHIHIGHALNKILKDMIVKWKALQGYDSFYLPGWDCHGLPIEHQLLKEQNKKKSDVDTVTFRKSAHQYAMKYVGIQREEFKRLGIFGEWDNPYLTLDPEYEYWILKSLAELNRKGFVYRGRKPVNWCFHCETALAEAEVEYEDHTSPSIYVKIEVENPQEILPNYDRKKKVYLLIWTTTPWTLLANVAVAINPTFNYKAVSTGEGIYIIEHSLAERVLGKGSQERIIGEGGIKPTDKLLKLTYKHPFGIKTNCKVVAADYVTRENGTGLVHTAPGHGQDDFQTGLKYKLDMLMPVDDRGIYTKEAGKYAGEHVLKANEKIIAELKDRGMLFARENLSHSYPHCWRCKNPIIFRATHQWFMNVDHNNLRGRLKEIIKHEVQWVPPTGEERILGMVTTRPDWCLSRQRHWGVPIPAIKEKGGSGEPQLFTEVIEHFANIVRKEGTDAWFKKDIAELLPTGFKDPKKYEKTHDILDVWFDSGVSHQAVVKAMIKKELPIDLYLEGSDQHRGWFQSSLIPAAAIENKAPFKAVLTHGFVVDGEGRKMSKSLGNVVSPQDVIKHNGADILRLWVASSSYNDDVRISKEILDRLVDAYRKIRNTMRYLLGNLYDFQPDKDVLPYAKLLDLDKWALLRLSSYIEEMKRNYDQFEFAKVYKVLYTFCNEDLSSFYLDILKDRLYTFAIHSNERRSAQTVLYHILNHLVRAMAPILVFTADEIFLAMPKDERMKKTSSVHLLWWLDPPAEWKNKKIEEDFQTLVLLRPYVLKALEEKRREGIIGGSLEAKVRFETASERDYLYLKDREPLLPAAFIVSQVTIERVRDITQGVSTEFSQTRVIIEQADGQKCDRCWNYKVDVGLNPEHANLCARCSEIVKEFE